MNLIVTRCVRTVVCVFKSNLQHMNCAAAAEVHLADGLCLAVLTYTLHTCHWRFPQTTS